MKLLCRFVIRCLSCCCSFCCSQLLFMLVFPSQTASSAKSFCTQERTAGTGFVLRGCLCPCYGVITTTKAPCRVEQSRHAGRERTRTQVTHFLPPIFRSHQTFASWLVNDKRTSQLASTQWFSSMLFYGGAGSGRQCRVRQRSHAGQNDKLQPVQRLTHER